MAGHSQFKNIMYRKGAQDKKRGKIFTKLQKEILIAVKTGGTDINSNPRLRSAIAEAKSNNMPKDNIERAIKKALGNDASDTLEEIRYEGYANGGIAVIVEALTDNRNRTAPEVRAAFTKYGGNLGETGSVNFMFDHVGIISFAKSAISYDELFEKALEAGAEDIKDSEDEFLVITSLDNLHEVSEKLVALLNVEPLSSNIQWIPKANIEITDENTAIKILKLINALEDLDDVQKVFSNFDIAEKILEKNTTLF